MTDIQDIRARVYTTLLLLALFGSQCTGVPVDKDASTQLPKAIDCTEDIVGIEGEAASGSASQEKILFIEDWVLSVIDPDGKNLVRVAEDVLRLMPAPDGRHVFYRLQDLRTFVYNVRSHRIQEIKIESPSADATYVEMTWSPDGRCLVSVDHENELLGLYHLDKGHIEEWHVPHYSKLYESVVSVSPDGKYLATGYGTVRISTVDGTEMYNLVDPAWNRVKWSPDGRYLLYSGLPAHMSLPYALYYADRDAGWTGSMLLQLSFDNFPNQPDGISGFEWSPDGTKILAGMGDTPPPSGTMIAIIDFPQGTYRLLDLGTLKAQHPSWSPDGEQIVFVGEHVDSTGIYTIGADGDDLKLVKQCESKSTGNLVWLRVP